jgi:hypothetical protein
MCGLATLPGDTLGSDASGMLFRKHIEELDRTAAEARIRPDKLEADAALPWDRGVAEALPFVAGFEEEIWAQRAEAPGPQAA